MAEPRTLYPGDGRFDSPGAHAPHNRTTEHWLAPLAQWQSPGPFIRETGGSIPPGRTHHTTEQLNTGWRPWLNGRAPDPLSGRRAVRFPRGARTTQPNN